MSNPLVEAEVFKDPPPEYFKLRPQHRLFVRYYLATFDAKRSAIMAGYSENNATNQGNRLMNREDVSRAVDLMMERVISEKIADPDEVLEFLTSVMRDEVLDVMVDSEGIQHFVRPSLATRIRCAEDLAKRWKLFTEAGTGPSEVTVKLEQPDWAK